MLLRKLGERGLSPVTYSQGLKLCKELKISEYVECSAMNQERLKTVFDVAVRQVILKATVAIKKKSLCSVM